MTEPVLRPVEIRSTDEPWTTIRLTDGTVLRVKLNITSVDAVFVDGERATDSSGQPAYAIKWVAATHVLIKSDKPDGRPN